MYICFTDIFYTDDNYDPLSMRFRAWNLVGREFSWRFVVNSIRTDI